MPSGDRRRGETGSPPPPGDSGKRTALARWARSRRLRAVGFLGLVAAGLGGAGLRGWREESRRIRLRPPFQVQEAEAVAPDGSVWRMGRDLRRPTVVLYVTWSCPHCRTELDRWAGLLARGLPDPAAALRVVADVSPPGDLALAPRLRERVLLDRGGSVGRALGARVVPTTAYLAPGGWVIGLVRGETSTERILRRTADLREASVRDLLP